MGTIPKTGTVVLWEKLDRLLQNNSKESKLIFETLGKNLNHEKLYFVNYDYILKDESYIDHISNILDKKDTYFGFDIAAEGNCYTTYFFAAKASVMLDRLKEIKNEQDYTQCMIDCGSESNGIENMYYHYQLIIMYFFQYQLNL